MRGTQTSATLPVVLGSVQRLGLGEGRLPGRSPREADAVNCGFPDSLGVIAVSPPVIRHRKEKQ